MPSRPYVVYIVTPDMWEEAWIRLLLAELPISRYVPIDLWTPPARSRRRRSALALQSRLPGGVRPARRTLRRLLDPHDFSILIYNTWALNRAFVRELVDLFSRFDQVGVVSIDESCQDSPEIYDRVAFSIRIGFDADRFRDSGNLLVAPLGVPRHFVKPARTRDIGSRAYSWSFLGEVKNESRNNMVAALKAVRGSNFAHGIRTWGSDDSIRGSEYSDILADSVFAPSPSANVHSECYRTYEALECGAIPVADTEYYRETFGAPFPVCPPTWQGAAELLNSFLDDAESLERLHLECQAWWDSMKQTFPGKIERLAATSRAGRYQPATSPRNS
jgi:hypothetical protein